MKIHPVAACFPKLEGAELKELVQDIKQHGLKVPLVTYEGLLLDGRNREVACTLAGVEPRYVKWEPRNKNDTPLDFAVSINLARRHLDASQRAIIADKLANLPKGSNQFSKSDEHSSRELSQSEAAKKTKVGIESVKRARVLRTKGTPALRKAAEQGKIKIKAAAAAAKHPKKIQDEVVKEIHAREKSGSDQPVSETTVETIAAPQVLPKSMPDINQAIVTITNQIMAGIKKLRSIAKFKQHLTEEQRLTTIKVLDHQVVELGKLSQAFVATEEDVQKSKPKMLIRKVK